MSEAVPEPPATGDAAPSPAAPRGLVGRHPTLVYTGLRLLLLLVTLGVVWLLGARGLLWLALGFVISGLLSLVLLSPQRDAMSRGVTGFFGRINERIEASKRAEDDDADVDADGDDEGAPGAPGDHRGDAAPGADAEPSSRPSA